jgi:hypothetical protein
MNSLIRTLKKEIILINIAILEFFKNSVFVRFREGFQVTAVPGVNTGYFFRTLPLNVYCLKASVLVTNPQKPYESKTWLVNKPKAGLLCRFYQADSRAMSYLHGAKSSGKSPARKCTAFGTILTNSCRKSEKCSCNHTQLLFFRLVHGWACRIGFFKKRQ